MKIYYWIDVNDSIYVEFGGEWNASIEIKNGVVSFEFEGEHEGPSLYFQEILLYDLCALGALYQEVKGDKSRLKNKIGR